ncbi:MAG: DUF177 domain-containing protein [Nitrospinae bacterium]|nr:DUF177 domain-containing protein [Nitrospinota bacterium]
MSSGKDPKLKVEISRIPDEGLVLEREDSPSLYELKEAGLIPSENVRLQGMVQKIREGAYLAARVSTALELECGRCLRPYPFQVQSDLRVFFVPESESSEDHEVELTSEDLDTYFHDGKEIDIMAPVRDQIVMAVPIQPLCSPDCPGLCPVCGKDLRKKQCGCKPEEDIDPRLSVLKNLIKRKE